MLVLSLDTTTRAGSVAVVRDDRLLSEIAGDPSRTHGERLPTDLHRALDAAEVTIPDLDLLAVVAGPGSFTGLRVGIAAMQGLAMAADRLIVPVSALDGLALAGARNDAPVGAWMDAQRGEVFAALYDPSGTHVIIEPSSNAPARTLQAWADRALGPVRFIGDGAVRYGNIIREAVGEAAEIQPPPPLASIVGRLAARFPERAVLPHAIVPIYIRKPDAELAREKSRG